MALSRSSTSWNTKFTNSACASVGTLNALEVSPLSANRYAAPESVEPSEPYSQVLMSSEFSKSSTATFMSSDPSQTAEGVTSSQVSDSSSHGIVTSYEIVLGVLATIGLQRPGTESTESDSENIESWTYMVMIAKPSTRWAAYFAYSTADTKSVAIRQMLLADLVWDTVKVTVSPSCFRMLMGG